MAVAVKPVTAAATARMRIHRVAFMGSPLVRLGKELSDRTRAVPCDPMLVQSESRVCRPQTDCLVGHDA
jgi:hypothetical protein